MNVPTWVKPGLYGAAVGAAALAIVGFAWGGWVTGGTAAKMADDTAQREVIAALVPICVQQSKLDPQSAATLTTLNEARSYQRNDVIIKAGWATMPGTSEPNKDVARACAQALTAPQA